MKSKITPALPNLLVAKLQSIKAKQQELTLQNTKINEIKHL
jgi:hypothetical protein